MALLLFLGSLASWAHFPEGTKMKVTSFFFFFSGTNGTYAANSSFSNKILTVVTYQNAVMW